MSGLVMLGSQAAGWVRSGRAARHRRRSARVARQPEILLPAGVDVRRLLEAACEQFVRLQAAWDAADLADLREFTTPEMFAEIKVDLTERGAATNQTDVVNVDAQMLGIEEQGSMALASVRFTGSLREAPDAAAEPFAEVWNLVKPLSGRDGWLLAGIQQEPAK